MAAMKELTCLNCKVDFMIEAYRKTARFCSKGCATSHRQDARDPNFLETPNELSSYLLGFILTDGSVSQQKGKKKRITLANTDFKIMNDLQPIIAPNRKLYKRVMKNKNHNTIYSIVNTNELAIKKLDELGIRENKSFNVRMPDIEEGLMSHFVRGVFDGDGSIYRNRVNGHTYKHISFTSASLDFSESLKAYISGLGFSPTLVSDSRENNNSHYVKLYRKEEVIEFGKWLYEDSNWYIESKKDTFLDDIV